MNNNDKSSEAYLTIGDVAKKLDLIDSKSGRLKTHTIRYWEKQFRQIKPVIMAGNRRYYSQKNFELIKLCDKFLAPDIAEVLKLLDFDKSKYLFELLDEELAADILIELEEDLREQLLDDLSSKKIVEDVIENLNYSVYLYILIALIIIISVMIIFVTYKYVI